jgi:AAA15 family ATPase/GTPase
MYKAVNSIKLLELHLPNLELSRLKNNSMVLNLHLLSNYRSFIPVILFLDVKKQFNLEIFKNDYLTTTESTYYLAQHTSRYNAILDGQVTVSFLNMVDFSNQKT